MKKFIIISLFLIGCRKVIPPIMSPIGVVDIFKQSEVSVVDGQDIQFNLTSTGKYTLTIYDSTTQNVVSKEKFLGVSGNNIKKIYTKSLTQKVFTLYLSDENNNQINKTRIIIN